MCVCVCTVSKYYKKYGLASTCLQNYRTVPYRTWKYGVPYSSHVPYSCLIYSNVQYYIFKLQVGGIAIGTLSATVYTAQIADEKKKEKKEWNWRKWLFQ